MSTNHHSTKRLCMCVLVCIHIGQTTIRDSQHSIFMVLDVLISYKIKDSWETTELEIPACELR